MAHTKTKLHHDDTDRLREEFDTLRSDFQSLARELRSFARHEEEALEGKASDRVVALKTAGEHQLELAKRYAADAGKAAEKTVREHPGYAVAGAAAVGFLLGALTLRHR